MVPQWCILVRQASEMAVTWALCNIYHPHVALGQNQEIAIVVVKNYRNFDKDAYVLIA